MYKTEREINMKCVWKRLLCGALSIATCLLSGCDASEAEKETKETEAPAETRETEVPEKIDRDYLDPEDKDTILRINPTKELGMIENKLSNMNMWNFRIFWMQPYADGYFAENLPFVKEIQFMTATGGELGRDLFKDPANRDVLDDYDFAPLIQACRNVVDQGIKPMLKTGNIPQKYSSISTTGTFGVNLYPPDNYDVYYNYIQAMTQALVDEFGLTEVQTWRWGCFTEYENADWFQGTCEDYCRIYDYTVAAIQSVLGFDIKIGAHSMTCTAGLWDEGEFIDHCINGTNYCTGEQGTRLTYLASSYYDNNINDLTSRTKRLTTSINVLRNQVKASIQTALASGITEEHLDKLGITSIYYGVDEGRILYGEKGRTLADLTNRIVGQTKQAAYDAMILDQMIENDIDYFSAWAYHMEQFYGLPTVSYHVANEFYKMVGTTQIETKVERYVTDIDFARTQDAVSSVDQNGTVYAMVYDFGDSNNNDLKDNHGNTVHILMDMDCEKAKMTISYVNDDSNFFDEWIDICKQGGLINDDFNWSPDSTDVTSNLATEKARQLYADNINYFTECSALITETVELTITEGELYYHLKLDPNSVAFLKIEPIE